MSESQKKSPTVEGVRPADGLNIFLIGAIPREFGGKTRGGGVAKHFWELANELNASGVGVTLMARNIRKSFTHDGIRVISFHEVDKLRIFSKSYWNRLVGFPIRLIHFHHINLLVIWFRILFGRKVKIVATIHSFNRLKEGYRTAIESINQYLLRWEARVLDEIIFPAEYILEESQIYLGKIKTPMRVFHNPIHIEGFSISDREVAKKELGIKPGRKTLLFVGTLNVHKGVLVLLEAFESLSKAQADRLELVMVGDGPLADEVRRACGRDDMHVRYEGAKEREELARYYNAADLFVMPSRGEGWGFVYGESLLCGTPVVACDISGVRTVLGGSYGVHLTPVDDSRALQATIEEALGREFDRDQLRKSALALDWKNHVHVFLELYRKMLAG